MPYILQSEIYSHPILKEVVLSFPIISLVLGYTVVFFQISFPYMIWNKSVKYVWIFLGISIHLIGIGLGMGLLTFGLIMSVSFLAHIDNKHAKKILNSIKNYFIDLMNNIKSRGAFILLNLSKKH